MFYSYPEISCHCSSKNRFVVVYFTDFFSMSYNSGTSQHHFLVLSSTRQLKTKECKIPTWRRQVGCILCLSALLLNIGFPEKHNTHNHLLKKSSPVIVDCVCHRRIESAPNQGSGRQFGNEATVMSSNWYFQSCTYITPSALRNSGATVHICSLVRGNSSKAPEVPASSGISS